MENLNIDPRIIFGFILLTIFTAVVTGMLFKKYYFDNLIHKQDIAALKMASENAVLKAEMEMQEATLQNISEEIHDDIGQKLSFIKFQLSHKTGEATNTIPEEISKVIHQLRNLTKSLSADNVRKDGLFETIRRDLEKIAECGVIETTLKRSDNLYYLRESLEIVIFRIYQEAVQNILKHSEATKALVKFAYEDDQFMMSIVDNGRGFNGSPGRGQGLTNMAKRAKSIGGDLSIKSDGSGTYLIFKMPIHDGDKN